MGGGLVFFGIGGDVSGGLFDAFSDNRSDSGTGNEQLEQRIERNEERLAAAPANEQVLAALVRDYYALASTSLPSGVSQYPEESKDELRRAGAYWQRYVDAADGPPTRSPAWRSCSTTRARSTSPRRR